MEIALFTFNPFQENTYLVYDSTDECIIFDPGMSTPAEQKVLTNFIEAHQLRPVQLVNTHCHIDHVLGNRFIAQKYNLKLSAHPGEKPVLAAGLQVSQMYGIEYDPSPEIEIELSTDEKLKFGNSEFRMLFTPGHSPASISFYNHHARILIAGDVLFQGSIGRTDLPGGDYDTLINSIQNEFFNLEDNVKVYPGHGAATTIGVEKRTNPFLI